MVVLLEKNIMKLDRNRKNKFDLTKIDKDFLQKSLDFFDSVEYKEFVKDPIDEKIGLDFVEVFDKTSYFSLVNELKFRVTYINLYSTILQTTNRLNVIINSTDSKMERWSKLIINKDKSVELVDTYSEDLKQITNHEQSDIVYYS